MEEPEGRWGARAAVVGRRLYMYRGVLAESHKNRQTIDGGYSTHLDVYDAEQKKWLKEETLGTGPISVRESAWTALGEEIYTFGGYTSHGDSGEYTNELHELNVNTRKWKELFANNQPSENSPLKKCSCGMVAYYHPTLGEVELCVFGGYAVRDPNGKVPTGVRFITDKKYEKLGRGRTNEINVFNVTRGQWHIPEMTGEGPPPCDSFTFIRVDATRIVLFGGWVPEVKHRNRSLYILKLDSWEWSVVKTIWYERTFLGVRWPLEREYHTGYSLFDPDKKPEHPSFIVLYGINDKMKAQDDNWIFDMDSQTWDKVIFSGPPLARWFHTGGVIHLSDSRNEVVTFGGVSHSWKEYKSSEDWPIIAETQVATLEFHESNRVAKRATGWGVAGEEPPPLPAADNDVSPLRNEDTERLFKNALKRGYVDAEISKVLIMGVPGAGKTHLRHLLFGLNPPDTRNSTACIEEAERALIEDENNPIKKVDDESLKELLLQTIKAGVPSAGVPSAEAVPGLGMESARDCIPSSHKESSKIPSEPTVLSKPTTPSESTTPSKSTSPNDESSSPNEPSIHSKQAEDNPLTLSSSVGSAAVEPQQQAMSDSVSKENELLELLKNCSGSPKLLHAKWLMLMDSGGQPQFLEILPAFVSNLSLQVIVFKLSEKLSDRPSSEFYISDIKYEGGHCLENKDFIYQCAQLSSNCQQKSLLPDSNILQERPRILIVGTFKDEEKEERNIKNKILKDVLKNRKEDDQNLIIHNNGDVIFGLDTLNHDKNVDETVKNLKQQIQKIEPVVKIQLPIAWYLLESKLKSLGKSVLHRNECLEIAENIGLSEDELDVALIYLHEISRILYYPTVLRDKVFIEARIVHDNVSGLLRLHLDKIDMSESDFDRIIEFRNKALFSYDTLSEVFKTDLKELFTLSDLLIILKHLLIVSEIPSVFSLKSSAQSKYFMPALLPEAENVRPHSFQNSEDIPPVGPLILWFPRGWPPHGLFCGLVNYLLSEKSSLTWSIPDLYTPSKTHHLDKNNLNFVVTNFMIEVTLIYRREKSCYEVYVWNQEVQVSCFSLILTDLKSGIEVVCAKLSYKSASLYEFAVNNINPCCEGEDRIAIIVQSTLECRCKKCGTSSDLSKKMQTWFQEDHNKTLYPHRKYHPAYPGICFLDDPLTRTVGSKGDTFSSEYVSVSLEVPPKAVPEGKEMQLTLWPCLYGPFSLPEGFELASPVYVAHATSAQGEASVFETDVKVVVKHFMQIEDDKDSENMIFVSAKLQFQSPCDYLTPKYHFKKLKGGCFEKTQGFIMLRHFCEFAIAIRTICSILFGLPEADQQNDIAKEASTTYSIKVFRCPSREEVCKRVIVAILKNAVEYIQDLKEHLKKELGDLGKCVEHATRDAVVLSCDTVTVTYDRPKGWELSTNRSPPTLDKDELQQPLPPQIHVQIQVDPTEAERKSKLAVTVEGTNVKDTTFTVILDAESGSNVPQGKKPASTPPAVAPVETRGTQEQAAGAAKRTELEEDDHLDKLLDMTEKKAAPHWRDIGRALGFKRADLDAITHKEACHSDKDYYSLMIKKWLNWAPPKHDDVATLEALIAAMRTIQELEKLANNVEKNFAKQTH